MKRPSSNHCHTDNEFFASSFVAAKRQKVGTLRSPIELDMSQSSSPTWTCSHCTLINDVSTSVCSACSAPNTEEDEASRILIQAHLNQEQQEKNERICKETELSKTGSDGQAFNFVRKVLEASSKVKGIEALAEDDLFFFAYALVKQRDSFKALGHPHEVSVAFHYTSSASISTIQKVGLLTKQERTQQAISASYHGAVYGDGVYTADNPFAFASYGDTGLICAILKGREFDQRKRNQIGTSSQYPSDVGAVIGNKGTGGVNDTTTFYDEIGERLRGAKLIAS